MGTYPFMDMHMTRYEALLACREKAGSISQLGRDLDIPQSTMSRIINQSKQLPAEYVLLAETLYGVSRHFLRPDIYPIHMPETPSRWSGVDQRAGIRANGVDSRVHRVAFNTDQKANGAAA